MYQISPLWSLFTDPVFSFCLDVYNSSLRHSSIWLLLVIGIKAITHWKNKTYTVKKIVGVTLDEARNRMRPRQWPLKAPVVKRIRITNMTPPTLTVTPILILENGLHEDPSSLGIVWKSLPGQILMDHVNFSYLICHLDKTEEKHKKTTGFWGSLVGLKVHIMGFSNI